MKLLTVLLSISTLIIVAISYMAFDNEPPYEYDTENSFVIPEQIDSMGDRQLIVHWAIKVNRLCPGVIFRTIIDARTGVKISYDATPNVSVKLTDTEINRTFFLPAGITAGEKLYQADGFFACNVLQRIYPLHVPTPRLRFSVLPLPPH